MLLGITSFVSDDDVLENVVSKTRKRNSGKRKKTENLRKSLQKL